MSYGRFLARNNAQEKTIVQHFYRAEKNHLEFYAIKTSLTKVKRLYQIYKCGKNSAAANIYI